MGLVRLGAVAVAAVLLVTSCSSANSSERATTQHPVGLDAAARTRAGVTLPPAAGVFDYQIGGAYRPAAAVQIVDRDRSDAPATGRYNICYVNAFQTQPDEAHFWTSKHPSLLLRVGGSYVHDPDWPGEYILDTSTAAKRAAILAIIGHWFDGCAADGFDAVEPDNLDSWTRRGVHRAITRDDNADLAASLVTRAHAHGLAVAQKNTVQLGLSGAVEIGFDFAIAEECEVYRECGGYTRPYDTHVLEVEYTDNGRAAYRRACAARRGKASIILRDRDVEPRGSRAYVYEHC